MVSNGWLRGVILIAGQRAFVAQLCKLLYRQVCNLLGIRGSRAFHIPSRSAGCKPAIQQDAILRYPQFES